MLIANIARGINIAVPIPVYIIVWLIIFFSSSLLFASIKYLNIDSSIRSVIIGHKNNDIVHTKSYVPYSAGDNFAVYNGNSMYDII